MPRRFGGCNRPERARSSPSPKSADCIITASAEQPEDNPHPHRVQRLRGKTRLPAPDFAPGVAPVTKTSTSNSLRGLQAFCQYAFASTPIVSPRTTSPDFCQLQDPTPSEADIKVTRDLIRAGQLLKIEVLDHVIMGQADGNGSKGYASLRELGYFFS